MLKSIKLWLINFNYLPKGSLEAEESSVQQEPMLQELFPHQKPKQEDKEIGLISFFTSLDFPFSKLSALLYRTGSI